MTPPGLSELAPAIRGAFLLLRFNAQGRDCFTDDPRDCIRSYWAAAFVAPGVAILIASLPNESRAGVPLARIFALETIFYTIGWTVWPLIVAPIARWFDFDARYCRYIAAYNWSSVPNVVLLLGLIGLMAVFGGGPEGRATPLVGLLSVILFFWLIAYHAYIVWIVAAPGKGAAGRGAAGLGLVILLVLGEAMIGEGLISFKNAVIAGG
ncbi:MAG: hypothetical protein QNJ84_04270 [Alphaproteobacteria bacterium]|nr:hypothetical protein [Alphaproteobacteria bacterium]